MIGIIDGRALRLLNVGRPLRVIRDRIDAEPDDLHVALLELGRELREIAELGRAHGREIFRMRKEDGPAVADPLMEIDRTLGRLGFEIRGLVVDSQGHSFTSV